MLLTWINFALFAGLLLYLVRKPFRAEAQRRASELEEARARALAAVDELSRTERQLEERKMGLARELDELNNSYREAALKEKEEIIANANRQASRIKEDAERFIAQEFEKARQELKVKLLQSARQGVRERLGKEIDSDAHVKIAEQSARLLGARG